MDCRFRRIMQKQKNINLELFDTDIIEYIGVEKVFTSPLYGDFAGANVDIASKKFSGKTVFADWNKRRN